ncbi:hypothetical protein FHS55_001592 [Angulomicrobium tetraedrale]|uniref:Uncharacterized protein n=1 Tax=Ancylobacter tetraedralis TaxID=217068 RepID=A0A839Z9I3_9HYPH|nr:hypothetical protein [Ancylobacter tetraedralis]
MTARIIGHWIAVAGLSLSRLGLRLMSAGPVRVVVAG